ncbi:Myb/SANT-like DNA-binding domain [Popillia japonica]|uniref:Myb/SANT-like DNA-binding domain n=1 Tax=Popillia japonica TaxID=7064 RepID=A0AAW1IF75_POPJA
MNSAEYVQRHFDEEHVLEVDNAEEDDDIGNDTTDETGSKWSHTNIKLLLELYRENIQLFNSPKKTNKSVWLSVAKNINERGYTFTGDQCDLKFRNLKKTYKRIVDSNGKTGRDAINWPYFSVFNDIFGTDADVTPTCLVSNTSGITYTVSNDAETSSAESSRPSSRAEASAFF